MWMHIRSAWHTLWRPHVSVFYDCAVPPQPCIGTGQQPRKGAHLQKHTNGTDWWWYLRLGMSFYQLSLFKEAIAQHEKSLALCSMDETALHLNKCYLRLDQPLVAAQMFQQMSIRSPGTSTLCMPSKCMPSKCTCSTARIPG